MRASGLFGGAHTACCTSLAHLVVQLLLCQSLLAAFLEPQPCQLSPQRHQTSQLPSMGLGLLTTALGSMVAASALALAVLFAPLLQGAQHVEAADMVWVTCGSTIKLAHSASGARLHSHGVAYSRGSQQQSVTGYPTSDDAQSYWIVHPAVDSPCIPGQPIKKQQEVRLQHATTRKWLHSHQFFSPMSGQQEVSAFGGDFSSDGGDVWTLEWDTKSKHWKQDAKVRLKHKDTGMFLSSSKDLQYGQPIHGQQEVSGVASSGKNAEWFAAEGVYLPRSDGHGKKKKTAGGDAEKKDGTDSKAEL